MWTAFSKTGPVRGKSFICVSVESGEIFRASMHGGLHSLRSWRWLGWWQITMMRRVVKFRVAISHEWGANCRHKETGTIKWRDTNLLAWELLSSCPWKPGCQSGFQRLVEGWILLLLSPQYTQACWNAKRGLQNQSMFQMFTLRK